MSDTIEKTIYKLELDDSAYIAGVERIAASTNKITQSQSQANQKLSEGEQNLKNLSAAATKLQQTIGGGKMVIAPTVSAEDQPRLEKQIQAYGKLRQLKNQIAAISIAGGRGTPEFEALQSQAISLQAAIRNTNKELSLSASNVSGIAALREGVRGVVGAFQAAAGAVALFGGDSKQAQEAAQAVIGTMGILNGVQEVAALLSKNSALNFYLQGLAHKSAAAGATQQAVAETALTVVEGEQAVVAEVATVAQKGLNAAMLANPVGAIAIALLGLFVVYESLIHIINRKTAAEIEAEKQQKILNDINTEAIKGYAAQGVHLNLLRKKIIDISIPEKDRVRLIGEYNKIADAGNQIDKTQINNLDLINGKIDAQIELIKQRAIARAAENIITKKAEALLTAQFAAQERGFNAFHPLFDPVQEIINVQKKYGKFSPNALVESLPFKNILDAKDDFDRAIKVGGGLINVDALTTKEKVTKDKKAKKELDDDFEKRKADILAQISALAASEFETEVKIRKQYADKLAKALLDIEKDKSITGGEKDQLNKLTGQLNDAELEKALKDFNKKGTDARKKLNNELYELQQKNNLDNLNLIKDDFDRRAKLIDFNEKKEIDDAVDAETKRFDEIKLLKESGLISNQDYEDAKQKIIRESETEITNITITANRQRQDLAADGFKASLDSFQSLVDSANLSTDEDTAKAIRKQSNKFLAGKITFEQFQKELTKIQKKGESDRRNSDLQDERTELSVLNTRIASIKDKTSQEYKDLIKLRDDFRKKIAEDEKDDAIKDAGDGSGTSPEAAKIIKYAEAIGSIADSVIQFWAKANEAETKALDRSISLQEKRVEAAQRIAARGNAQYLKQEEDRLKELNVKRENAARKQLGIDAALQASQILVAITGAIAKIANPVPGAGIAETIAAVAIIIGSLATGYGLVKSLQGNQPKLAKGKKYVTRDGHRSGIDTIPAWLNEGEAVIPTDRNRAYHPTVAAIYDGTIPADHMNSFVNAYHRVKGVPMPNYNRIGEAAGMSISADGKMAVLLSDNNKKLDESNELSRQTLKAMKSMNVSANIDRDGVAIMVNEYIGKMEIDKRV